VADLAAVRNALAATITANTNINGQPLPAVGYLPGQVNPPMAIVAPQPGQMIVFDTLDGGSAIPGTVTYHLRVVLLVAYGEDASTQAALDLMLSTDEAGSVINAITQHSRLDGSVHYAVVTTAHGYGLRLWNDVQYFGAELLVSVAA